MTYSIDKMATWTNLADHLNNPVGFPVGITTHFLVAFSRSPHANESHITFPWTVGESVVFLGEIPGMRGHGIFAGDDGLVRFAYHTHDFSVIPEEEL